jgi:glycosyltransferase involved in cell wall biosynthesis
MTRVLIYAQVPPPVHGQSVMAQHLIEGLRGTGQVDLSDASSGREDALLGYVHVNPQLSNDLADIGRWRPGKILKVFAHIFEAIRAKFRYRLDTFYFVPAPPKREALYRDWAVLFLCRPFFRKLVLHWHCIGQREFLARKLTAPERWLAHLCYGRAALSIALSQYSEEEASMFRPLKSVIVPNGIPDPCPEFDAEVWPERQKRWQERAAWDEQPVGPAPPYEVLFLAGRMTPKGLFDAIEAAKLANGHLERGGVSRRIRLTVAGSFDDEAEKARFEGASVGLNATQAQEQEFSLCVYAGWADEAKKHELFSRADCFIFPTTYPSESFGLVLAEAMAHGCAVITTRWQAVPEVLPPADPNVVEPRDIDALAAALLRCAAAPASRSLRDYFLAHFTRERFARDMARALSDV